MCVIRVCLKHMGNLVGVQPFVVTRAHIAPPRAVPKIKGSGSSRFPYICGWHTNKGGFINPSKGGGSNRPPPPVHSRVFCKN